MKNLFTIISSIVATILTILGISTFLKRKGVDTVLADNEKTKEKLKELDTSINNVNTSLVAEEKTRLQLKEDMEKAKNEEPTEDNVIDFFNKR